MSYISTEPSEFKVTIRPYHEESFFVRITNVTDCDIVFSVKTTNPSRYCVIPVQGIIRPGDAKMCRIVITRTYAIPENKEFKDKFRIMSSVLTSQTQGDNLKEVWKRIESDPYATVQKNKVVVIGLDLEKRVERLEAFIEQLRIEREYDDMARED